jgi:hypothetical protein
MRIRAHPENPTQADAQPAGESVQPEPTAVRRPQRPAVPDESDPSETDMVDFMSMQSFPASDPPAIR